MPVGSVGGGVERTDFSTAIDRSVTRVEAQKTPVTKGDLRGAIGRAYQKVNGKAASGSLLDTLTAHASLETGSGSAMYNYNFGGIKGAGPSGATAVARTKEVLGGREIEVRDGFRAYRSLDEGAVDYVKLMQSRFGGAVGRAEAGDVDGFAHALKQAHYYTADETKYADGLRAVAGMPSGTDRVQVASASPKITSNFSLGAGFSSDGPTTVELGRVLDAIARHPVTVDDEDEDA